MCVPDLDNQVYFFNHYFQHNVLKHFSQNGKTNDLTFIWMQKFPNWNYDWLRYYRQWGIHDQSEMTHHRKHRG